MDSDQHINRPSEVHTLTSKEVAKLFEQAGIPRSPRSAERYCEFGKLDCIKDPDEGRWYASQKGVDLLIRQLKELQARHQQSEGGTPPEVPEGDKGGALSDAGGPSPPLSDKNQEAGDPQSIKELEDKVWSLKLEDGIKERLLLQAKKDKDADRADLLALSREVGVLATENKQLRGLLAAGGQPTGGADRQEDTKPEESEDTEATEGESMSDNAEDEEPRPIETKP